MTQIIWVVLDVQLYNKNENVAESHDESNQKNEEDSLIVSICAGFFNLDKGSNMHAWIDGAFVCLSTMRVGRSSR